MSLFRLALPLAWLTSTLLVFPFRWPMLVWIAGAFVTGRIIAPRIGRIRLALVLEAGMICGIVAFSNMLHEWGWAVVAIGALMGLLCAIVWSLTVMAAEWLRARPGSLLDGVAIRRTWITAALISLALARCWRWAETDTVRASYAMVLDLSVIGVCALIDAWRFSSLRHWKGDLGVGDPSIEIVADGSPYRQEPRVITTVRGDLEATRRLFRRHLAFDVTAVALAVTALFL